MNFSLKQIVSFILANHITPSRICETMGSHYRDNAADCGEIMRERWLEVAATCDEAARLFKKVNI
jgi:hypothetical protein